MGNYVKVYLTDSEQRGLEALKTVRAGRKENTATNAILKEGLMLMLEDEGMASLNPHQRWVIKG